MNTTDIIIELKKVIEQDFKPLKCKGTPIYQNHFEDCLSRIAQEYGTFNDVRRLRGYVTKVFNTKPSWGCNQAIKVVNSAIKTIYNI